MGPTLNSEPHERAAASATLAMLTMQATPTEDATVTALNKEKLAQEVQQLKEQNEPDFLGWLRANASILLSTLVVVVGGLIGLWRWLGDRRDAQDKELKNQQNEREKRAEERFQGAVAGLGDEKEEARAGAAIMLRTFLQPDYEQFYQQSFDLAVTHLRLRYVDPNIPEPLDSLSQALITVFKESFPLARNTLDQRKSQFDMQALDASHVRLDNAYLDESDLKGIWMRVASLKRVRLRGANLSEANLRRADLRWVYFNGADLSRTNLSETRLSEANLSRTDLRRADLHRADFSRANLRDANLSGATLTETNLEDAHSLTNTDLRGARGLTKEQLEVCKAKGAIIDEELTTSASQSTVAPSLPPQSNDTQPSSAPSA